MRFRRKSLAGLALAVASITALAACSSSRYRSGGPANGVKVPGGIGSVPMAAAGGTKRAGTITWALEPDAARTGSCRWCLRPTTDRHRQGRPLATLLATGASSCPETG
jgi:hypothetical protein